MTSGNRFLVVLLLLLIGCHTTQPPRLLTVEGRRYVKVAAIRGCEEMIFSNWTSGNRVYFVDELEGCRPADSGYVYAPLGASE